MKDLIVHVDNSTQCAKRVEWAARLAHRFEAHLHGVCAQHVPLLPADGGSVYGIEAPAVTASERIAYSAQVTRAEAEAAEEVFRAGSAPHAIATSWHTMLGSGADVVAAYARYTDLAIVGQSPPGGEDIAAEVVLRSGRPVLIAPHAAQLPIAVERVLVAWDASREAARALHDALPLLAQATQVTVLSVGAPEKTPAGVDIGQHLALYGIKAALVQDDNTDSEAGRALLTRAETLGCDLIVMGAYGHSRLRERVLGGTTHHVLQHMTVPVLIAH